jgi:surface polysaccharide O-acyltransferase-like enzyme
MTRNYAIDALRIIAILGVILIHVTSRSLAQGHYDLIGLYQIFFFERLARFAVPLFFIISGYTLQSRYDKTFDIKKYYTKRASRLLIPYICWSFLYAVLNGHLEPNMTFFKKLVQGGTAIHLYFIPVLFIMYALFPLIRKIQFTKFTFGIYTFIQFSLLTMYYLSSSSLSNIFVIALLCVYLFITGMLTYRHQKELVNFTHRYFRFLLFTLIGTILLLYQTTFTLFLKDNDVHYIDSQWQPLIFLYAVLIWIICFSLLSKRNIPSFARVTKNIFFVYFVHIFYITVFWKLIGSYLFSLTQSHILFTWWFTPLIFLFTVFASFSTGLIMSYIPKLRTIVGIDT